MELRRTRDVLTQGEKKDECGLVPLKTTRLNGGKWELVFTEWEKTEFS